MSVVAVRSRAGLNPLDAQLSPEVLNWVTELRVLWAATGLSINQFVSLHPINKGTVSRYLNGQRVPGDHWFLDKLLAIQADNGHPVTPTVREHLTNLQLYALQVAHPHEYRVRLVRDELEIAIAARLEAERYARALEEQLAERNRQVRELTDDKAAWDAANEAMQAEYERLTREVDEITGELDLTREQAVEVQQRCEQLEDLLDQLDAHPAASDGSASLMASTLAHELRSPLTSVKGFTATLLAKWSRFSDNQKLVMLETVNSDADYLARLINDLLDASKIESGWMEIRPQLVDIPARVRKAITGHLLAEFPIPEDRFRLEVRDGLPETWLDPDKTDRIVSELIANAVVHGAGIVVIVVEPAHIADAIEAPANDLAPPNAVAVSVRDHGPGISPDNLQCAFDQYPHAICNGLHSAYKGWPKRRFGLGLYIVKGLVEAHGGTISVQNAAGGGAEFRLVLPANGSRDRHPAEDALTA